MKRERNCSGSARPKRLWQLERDYDLRDRLYHVEARPVGASEFRRVYSETRRLSVCRLSAPVGRRRAAARQSRNRAVCAASV